MRNPFSASPATASTSKTPCCTKVGLKKGPWTPEEDELLAKYIKREGEGRWRTLPRHAGLLRCGKSCRLRWMNYLRPSVKRGQIAPDEEDLILRLHRLLGNRWALISGRIPGRTDNEIKNYWNTHLSKKLISQGIDPRTHKPLNPNPNSSSPGTVDSTAPNPDPNPNPIPSGTVDSTAPNLDPNPNPIPSGTVDSAAPNPNPSLWNTHLSKKGIDPRTHKPLNPDPNPHFSGTIDSTAPNPDPNLKPSETVDSTAPNPNKSPNHNPHFSGLERTRGSNRTAVNNPNATNLDQFHGQLVVSHSNENLEKSDGFMMGLQSSHESYSNGEYFIQCCNDDLFSSFLNSLINEDGFPNQQPNGISPSVLPQPVTSSTQSFNLGTVWEAAITSTMTALSDQQQGF